MILEGILLLYQQELHYYLMEVYGRMVRLRGDRSRFESLALQQCFEIDLTLTGTWITEFITPQHYGAITNATTAISANDCTTIIQKCVDSLFHVSIPSGFYYITNSIIITQPVTIVCDPNSCEYSNGSLLNIR